MIEQKISELKSIKKRNNEIISEFESSDDKNNLNIIDEKIAELNSLREELVPKLTDTSIIEKEIINYFNENRIQNMLGVSAKTRKKNEVNMNKFFNAIGNNIDLLLTNVSIAQSGLKKITEETGIKFPKDVVETTSEIVTSISIDDE